MIETLKNAFRNKDIRKKIFMTFLLLLLFRFGCYIPIPGLDRGQFGDMVSNNDFLNLMSGITGSALANGTLFALGIGPYINASIIIQLLTVGIPALERLSKQGEEGRKKITNITRIVTIILAVIQSVGIIVLFGNTQGAITTSFFFGQTWLAGIFMTLVYTAGSCLVMWIGERITDYGVGNGISLIIFIGILSTAGTTILNKLLAITSKNVGEILLELAIFAVVTVVLFFLIVFVDLAERKIPVQYAKQVRGTKSLVPSWSGALEWWQANFSNGSPWYIIVLCVLIFVFSFFYAQIQFNPEDVSKSIQQNGGFIQGIRPGKPTAQYLKKINNRITLFGAIFLTLVAFIPSIAFSWASYDLVNVFSTTGILIVVSVALEFDKQLQSQIMMKNYKGFLK